jgi:hypothetical protein
MVFINVSENKRCPVTISIVSHGQGEMVAALLGDLAKCAGVFEVLVIQNIPEPDIPLPDQILSFTKIFRNKSPLGFAANHNAAFCHCNTPFFCIINPDIRLPKDPFHDLLECFSQPDVALVAPVVLNSKGDIEDSARFFPTPLAILLKAIGLKNGRFSYRVGDELLPNPDWLAGMFMLVRSDVFRRVNGFDTKFYLYYEDVDLCARLRKSGYGLRLCPSVHVVHYARRTSHRNLRYMKWHIASMVRYFIKHLGRLLQRV